MSAEILIIDDNADIRLILDELIKDAGYMTRLAANFNQALTEIDKKLPDVAIIDVKLDKGDNDGILLLDHIKNKKTKDIIKPYFTTKEKGTGLGLSIVDKIISDHEGSIKFLNHKNGAKIQIIIPYLK